MDDLLERRGELELAYNSANEAVHKARDVATVAKAAVIDFDKEHPEVMASVKAVLNQRKHEAGELARIEREDQEAKDAVESKGGEE